MTDKASTDAAPSPQTEFRLRDKRHIGLGVMALTEVWERVAYYGMRAILVLFLVDAVQGFALEEDYAASIYGLFLSTAYMTSLLGGWFGDRVFGTTKAVIAGALFLIAGNSFMAMAPSPNVFFFGMLLLVLGISLLKPNISAIVSFLYPAGGAERDTAFYIFFLSTIVGALIGPFIVAGVADAYGYQAGFWCAAAGMTLGLIQLFVAIRIGLVKLSWGAASAIKKTDRARIAVIGVTIAAILGVASLILSGAVSVDIRTILDSIGFVLLAFAVGYFCYFFFFSDLTREEKKSVGGLLILFCGSILFYMGFSQPGSSFNLFALRFTDRTIFGYEVPTGYFQSISPAFTLLLAPFVSSLWLKLEKAGKNPPVVAKFSLSLFFSGAAFLIMAWAARAAAGGELVSPLWLTTVYFVQTFSEIILIPIGLSFVTKLMPERYVGQGMGIWFLSVSIGYLIGGRLAGGIDYSSAGGMVTPFIVVGCVFLAGAAILAFAVRPARPLFQRVE